MSQNKKIAIIGAGLCGCTLATLLSKKGYTIDIFEKLTKKKIFEGENNRSINLALSYRGFQALKSCNTKVVNIEDSVRKNSIPMEARYYHFQEGKKIVQKKSKIWQYSHLSGEFNYSILRNKLNEILITDGVEGIGKITIQENQEVKGNTQIKKLKEEYAAVIHADGIHSALREFIEKANKSKTESKFFNYSYFEIKILGGKLEFTKKEKTDYFHIWSLTKNLMIVAMPNAEPTGEVSYNCIVFFPDIKETDNNIQELTRIEMTTDYDKANDPLEISKEEISFDRWSSYIINRFVNHSEGKAFIEMCERKKTKLSFLEDIKCPKWNFENTLVIGDAAHAVLPFHGQGANAAMEDALILSQMLPLANETEVVNWNSIFQQFYDTRKEDADALFELARINHESLTSGGNGPDGNLKSEIKREIAKKYSSIFESEYHSVTFNNVPYSTALNRFNQEEKLAQFFLDYHRKDWKKIVKDEKKCSQILYNYISKTSFNSNIAQVKKQYQFNSDSDLLTLIEGLANQESRGVTYWDYIEVDTLLSLQKGKTNFPDEVIFITYHQICELYFKLIIQELEKIALPEKHGVRFLPHKKGDNGNFTEEIDIIPLWEKVLTRVVRYINKLTTSFDIMKDGLDGGQFGVFRKSLLPASGFQTYQFRLIEIMLTPFENLIMETEKETAEKETEFRKKFDHIYWRSGVIEKETGKKAKILVNFNDKYDETFKEVIKKIKGRTIYSEYLKLNYENKDELKEKMFDLDKSILKWKLSHFAAATRHLGTENKGTGGTKWDEYLLIKRQKINYFPTIWNGKDFNSEVNKLMKELR